MIVKVSTSQEFEKHFHEMKSQGYICKHHNYECMRTAPAMDFVMLDRGVESLDKRVILCKDCRLCR